MILLARNMGCAPRGKSRKSCARFITERRELRIAYTPPAVELLNNELAVKEELQFRCSEFSGKLNCRYDRLPLRNVVRSCPDRGGDGGIRLRGRVIGTVTRRVVECYANGCWARIPSAGAVRSTDQRAHRALAARTDRRRNLKDRLRDVDSTRTGVNAVEGGATAPDAIFVAQDV
jgi:hypothetical protein